MIWYIVDGKTGGVIVFLWFFIFVEIYFILKFPRFIVIVILSMVTQILIIGYDLVVRKIGVKAGQFARKPSAVADITRLRRSTDNLHIQSISSHRID